MQEPAIDSSSNTDGRKLQCPECNRRFIRPEHMRRHLRNHDTSKRFTCHVCSKKFARSDILSKHLAAHVADPSQMPVQPHSNGFVPRKSRACYACAKAREKCSKELPCMRCSRRFLACVYPGHQQYDKYDQHSVGGNNSTARQSNTENISATDLALTPGDISVSNHTLAALMFDGTHSKSENASSTSTGSCTTAIQNTPWGPIAACAASNNELASISASDHDPSGSVQQWPFRNDGLESGVEVSNQPINWLPFDELIESNLGSILGETIPLSQNDGAQWLFIDSSNATNGSPQGGSWNLDIPLLTDIDDEKSNGTSPNIAKADFPPSKSTPSANYRRGDLYATSSNGARNACSTRAKRYGIFRKNEFPQTDHPRMNSTTLNEQVGSQEVENMDVSDDGAYHPATAISSFTYDTILQHFDEICLQKRLHMPCFGTKSFPSLKLLNLFVKLYFKCFDPILPFIHLPSLDMNKSWVLTVAIAAIGSHYCQSQEPIACSSQLHEFCKVFLQQESERSQDEMTDLPMLQARILNQIEFCYSESGKLDSVIRSIGSFNLSLVNLKSYEHLMRNRNNGVLESHDWDGWVMAESWRRLYFTTRVLHIMMIYHFNLPIDHGCGVAADFDLPQEKLWQARTHEDWIQLFLKTEGNPSLREATNELFQTKSVKPDLGEFSHCIILHELYNEIANITTYHSRKLAPWTPTSESTSMFPVSSSESLSLGDRKLTVLGHSVQHSNATSDWRNAALDCIDVLHWAANAKIASLSGMEHPMVLHLHYSRIVLLVPRVALMTIAESALPVLNVNETGIGYNHNPKAVEAAEHHIREWTQRDSSKARLAVIHSGCVFWHIRRYSRATFYDPLSAFYATLALWAYGFYTPKNKDLTGYAATRVPGRGSPYQEGTISVEGGLDCNSSESDVELPLRQRVYSRDRDPTFIRLDRPNDDEMVQLFVSSSQISRMSALVSGVGDICGPEGPALVLKEGRAVLNAIPRTWIKGSHYMDMLLALEMTTRSRFLRQMHRALWLKFIEVYPVQKSSTRSRIYGWPYSISESIAVLTPKYRTL